MSAKETRRVTLQEFLADDRAPKVTATEHFNDGAFMNCHCRVFAETGVWIDELVPVFQKLDAHLAVANEKVVRELSPRLA